MDVVWLLDKSGLSGEYSGEQGGEETRYLIACVCIMCMCMFIIIIIIISSSSSSSMIGGSSSSSSSCCCCCCCSSVYCLIRFSRVLGRNGCQERIAIITPAKHPNSNM